MEEKTNDNKTNSLYSLEELVKLGRINKSTYDKVKLGSSIIEKKYLEKETQYFKNEKIYNEINNYFNNISYIPDSEKEEMKKVIFRKISKYYRYPRQKIDESRFEIISEIGKGGFGKVKLCRDKTTNEVLAMKKLNYDLLINNAQLFHIKTEKDILTMSNNVWKANLDYSFINDGYLYFIMDYYPGGDLLHYMNKKDTLTEDEARFYIAEIILAVDSLHKNNCIHRDIKPDNFFIDKNGHLKIGDFGLSILSNSISYPYTYKWNKKNCDGDSEKLKKLIGFSNVGSLLYVAPEVIEKKSYGAEIDWWSVGIIFYEMLVGFPPFWGESDTPKATGLKLKNFKKYLNIPKGVNISPEAKKLIFDFLSERENRLGVNGIDEIKNHKFFKNFDWENIRKMKPPFVPNLVPFGKGNLLFMKRRSLKFYTSKENLNVAKTIFEKEEKEKENKLKKVNLHFYDFYYNKDLVEVKNQIENNLEEFIKNEIENFSKISSRSVNMTLEETSTEEIISLKSNESGKNKKKFLNNYFYNSDIKNKTKSRFTCSDKKPNGCMTSKFRKQKSIQIIPVRNLMNNLRDNYRTLAKDKSLRKSHNFEIFPKRKSSNNSIIIKDNESINSEVVKPRKINFLTKKEKKTNINISMNRYKNEFCKKITSDYDTKKIKINGKLIMVKKNLGK